MTAGQDLVEVRILQMPVDVLVASQEHQQELVRELTLVAEQLRQEGTAGLPVRLIDVTQELTSAYGGFTVEQDATIATAIAEGERVIGELVYRVPPAVARAAEHLDQLLDEADAYCRDGQHLLTLGTPPQLRRLRQWFLAEFVRQIAGEPPMPWPEYLQRSGSVDGEAASDAEGTAEA